MDRRAGVDPFAGLKEDSKDYTVYDSHYEKIGKVDDLIVDEDDQVLYVGVKMGFLGTNSTMVPAEIIRVNDKRHLIEVSEPAETVKHAPHFGKSEDLTAELENHVRTYFGLEGLRSSPEHEVGPDILAPPTSSSQGQYPQDWVETVPIERAETENRPGPFDWKSHEEEPHERPPEPTEPEERPRVRRIASERSDSGEQVSSRPSDEQEGRWEETTAASGLKIHRLRR